MLTHRPPKAFDDRSRADLSDSSELLLDSKSGENVAKQRRCKLRSLIRNEVPGNAVLFAGCFDDLGELASRRFFEEQSGGERKARKHIEQPTSLNLNNLNRPMILVMSIIQM